ncbi:MAG: alpha-L-fucosidase 2 [Kribbellaceae bacterium]|nr:alpha-L-fucosidase 2 [Kribbellaceae bacterium]
MLSHQVIQPTPQTTVDAGRLWFSSPATRWFEALPIGNGRLGGMVYSGDQVERIQLSESTAWSGAPATSDVSPTALQFLPRVRELLLAGRYAEAQQLAGEHLLGRPTSFGTNVPLPELQIEFTAEGETTDYTRSLDLKLAMVRTEFRRNGITFTREVFASHTDDLIVVRLESSTPGALGFKVSFSDGVVPAETSTDGHTVILQGHAFEELHSNGRQGTAFDVRARAVSEDGNIQAGADHLLVENATTAIVLIAAGTSWGGETRADRPSARIEYAASSLSYDGLLLRHAEDYVPLINRVQLDLGRSDDSVRALPTDERRALLAKGGEDPELLALYFQYGRYLTIAGSREDSPLPLALQGLWNDGRASSAPWSNDFHLDINTQQNYWAAEITGLAECQYPLFRFINGLRESGRRTAAEMYGAPGWVSHTVTNAWGYSAPGSGLGWGLHVTSGIWISLQLWEHFEYNRNLGFLAEEAYPVLRDAARFFLSYLVEEPTNGWLVSGPSDSPENWYRSPDGEQCSISMGATCDRVLVEALFRICVEASELLGIDEALRQQLQQAREKLTPFQIGKHGQLQEWLVDFDEAVPSHRHTTHLIALYPERQITPRDNPELARAAEVTIQRRQSAEGWEQTEWVEANFVVYYARLLKGDLALQHLRNLIGDASEHNLLSYSAGGIAGAEQNIYSFDGNAGGSAGVAEMLVQSTNEEIELLPALPATWTEGTVRGLRARGGFIVDVTWREGRLESALIRSSELAFTSSELASTTVRYGDDLIDVTVVPDSTVEIRPTVPITGSE